jgi:molecular chaperone DnaK
MAHTDKHGGGPPAQLRIRLKYVDVQSFIEKFATNISRGGMFIASRAPKAVGTLLRFELLLADGKSKLLKGEGVVAWIREFDEANPGRAHGMGVRFARLDADSRALLERIDAYKRERGVRADDSIPPPPGADLSSPPAFLRGDSLPVEPLAAPPLPPPPTRPTTVPPMARPATASLVAAATPAFGTRTPRAPRTVPPEVAAALTVMPSREAAELDIEALLGADGPTLEATLTRARAIAHRLAGAGGPDEASGDEALEQLLHEPPPATLPAEPFATPAPKLGTRPALAPAPATMAASAAATAPAAAAPAAARTPAAAAPPAARAPAAAATTPAATRPRRASDSVTMSAVPVPIADPSALPEHVPLPIADAPEASGALSAQSDRAAALSAPATVVEPRPLRLASRPMPVVAAPAPAAAPPDDDEEDPFSEGESTHNDIPALPPPPSPGSGAHPELIPAFVLGETSTSYYDSVERTDLGERAPSAPARGPSGAAPGPSGAVARPSGAVPLDDDVSMDELVQAALQLTAPRGNEAKAEPPSPPTAPDLPAPLPGEDAALAPPAHKKGFFSKLFKK